MIILKDGQFAVMTSAQSVMLFSFSSAGYAPTDDGIVALDDRCELINDRRIAISRLVDFVKFHPDTNFYFSYDGEQTIMIIGVLGDEPLFGYVGPYADPLEAVTEAEDIRVERLKTAGADPQEPNSP